MQFTLSTNTIIWETRHLNNTINLVFMINWFVNNVINCETRFDFNQSSSHISIFIIFTFEINFVSIKQKKAWKRVDVEKLRNNLRLFIVSSSLNIVEQMKIFVNHIQLNIHKAIDAVVSWAKLVRNRNHIEIKNASTSYWQRDASEKSDQWCAQKQLWQKYFKMTNEKKKIIARKEN
jgi:hypothetical protein